MKLSCRITRRTEFCALLFLLVLLFSMAAPFAAYAGGGLAMSGSFYRQEFEIPQGTSIQSPSVFVVVFNNGTEELKVKMSSQAPLGVNISLSETAFSIPPNGQQQVLVEVAVAKDAAPGDYEVSVTAESYKEGVSGIQLAGAASQKAKLKVLGESALISAQATSPDGSPIVATIRLYRQAGDQQLEVSYSETGKLEVKVAPGSFIAVSYIGGEKVAEESFTVAANDNKTVILSGKTVYFQGFGEVPNSRKSDGKLAFAEIVYSIKNLYQSVPKAEIFLEVSMNGTLVEEFSLATLSPLELGSKEFSYRYIPSEGWQDGDYSFKLRLELDGKLYTTSPVEQLQVSNGIAVDENTPAASSTPAPSSTPKASATAPAASTNTPTATGNTPPASGTSEGGGGGAFPVIIGGIVAAVVVLAGAGWLFMRRKKQ